MDACGIARRPARHACAVALDDASARHVEGTRGSTQAHPVAAPALATFAAGLRACSKSLSARTHPRGKLDDEGAHSHRAKTSRAHRADRLGTVFFLHCLAARFTQRRDLSAFAFDRQTALEFAWHDAAARASKDGRPRQWRSVFARSSIRRCRRSASWLYPVRMMRSARA